MVVYHHSWTSKPLTLKFRTYQQSQLQTCLLSVRMSLISDLHVHQERVEDSHPVKDVESSYTCSTKQSSTKLKITIKREKKDWIMLIGWRFGFFAIPLMFHQTMLSSVALISLLFLDHLIWYEATPNNVAFPLKFCPNNFSVTCMFIFKGQAYL